MPMANQLVGLDTSVVLRLLTGAPPDQAKTAVALLDRLHREQQRPAVSDLVLSEVYYALQYHYRVPKAEVLAALRAFVDSGEVVVLRRIFSASMTKS